MLSEKPWKLDAVVRLFLNVLVCVLIGASAVGVVDYFGAPRKVSALTFCGLAGIGFAFLAGALFVLRKPWRLETFTRQFLTLLGCIFFGFAITLLVQHLAGGPPAEKPVRQMIILTLSIQGAALVLVHRFLHEHEMSWSAAFGFKVKWGQALLLGIMIAFIVMPIGHVFQSTIIRTMEHFHVRPAEQQAVQALRTTELWPERLALGLVAIVLAPMAEEILFRGILYPAIKQVGFPRLALWGTALLFAAVHANLPSFLPLVLLAIVLTLLYEKTNNLLAPIVAHSLFNAINFAMLYLLQQRFSEVGRP